MKIDCPHTEATTIKRVCPHLVGTTDTDYKQFFTGVGQTYELICFACADAVEGIGSERSAICAECFEHIEEECYWNGIAGQPEIRREKSSLAFVHRTAPIENLLTQKLVDISPVDCSKESIWIALDHAGNLLKIDCGQLTFTTVTQVEPSDLNLSKAIEINISPEGNFAALTETLGEKGVVINLSTGQVTMRLQRDNYHSDVSCFPITFFLHREKELIVHGTAWNRLDISDPMTGTILTARTPPESSDPRNLPEHYLDYFHGQLVVSPDQTWIADNGWAWAPAGIVVAWNLRRWIEANPWESEDGESKKWLCQRSYFWDGPSCWIGNQTFAVWGYGDDDEWLIPAVRLFDMDSKSEIAWFAGPQVAPKDDVAWPDKLAKNGRSLIFDKYLFALSPKYGISVWDAALGACLLEDSLFAPVQYHRGSKEFLSFTPEGAIRLSRLIDNV